MEAEEVSKLGCARLDVRGRWRSRGTQRIRTPSSRLAAWRLLDDAHAREGRLRQDEEMVEIERGEK